MPVGQAVSSLEETPSFLGETVQKPSTEGRGERGDTGNHVNSAA